MDANVIYALIFVAGAVAGGIIVFFVLANNKKRAMALLEVTAEQLDKLKGK
jgi:hypothetical protein